METPTNKSLGSHCGRLRALIRQHWQPKPVTPPIVDPELKNLTGVQRVAETMRYSILSVEFWISPNGQVREWLRQNTLLAVILAIPAFLVLPIITFALWQLVSWTLALTTIAGKLIVPPILVLLAVASFAATIGLIRFIFSK